MNETVTATFGSEAAMKNVVEALIDSVGVPQEKIYVDKDRKQVKVIIPAATESEVRHVMQAHNPMDMSERLWGEA